jgi:hypothetical protein
MSLMDPNPVNTKSPKRVAIVVSNPATSTTTGWPVGFWWSELAHPFFLLSEKGYVYFSGRHGSATEVRRVLRKG